MEKGFKIGAVQLMTEADFDRTALRMRELVREAADKGADVVLLPEMWSCLYSGKYFALARERGHEEAYDIMSTAAKENNILLVGGSVPEVVDGRMYNTCFIFGKDGTEFARHRKIHLFDVDLPGMRFKESDTFCPGEEPTVFKTDLGTFGAAICFDIRFPELFRLMANRGAEVIFLPAQFNMTTGPAHWETTLRARAIDNQVYFAACAAAATPGFGYECWGHSMIIDPYGTVLTGCGQEETVIYAEINPERINEVRRQLPTSQHLRENIYNVAK